MKVYCLPGMSTDRRVFDRLDLSEIGLEVVALPWPWWQGATSLQDFARRVAQSIPKDEPYLLLGVSMGGMVMQEVRHYMTTEHHHPPRALALISSATGPHEFPFYLKMMRGIAGWTLVRNWNLKLFSASPAFFRSVKDPALRPMNQAMVRETGAPFLRWQMKMVARWKPSAPSVVDVRIHSYKDKVLPLRNIDASSVHRKLHGTHRLIINEVEALTKHLKELLKPYVS